MKKEIVEKLISRFIPDAKINSIEVFPRQELTENGQWVSSTSSIFVGITFNKTDEKHKESPHGNLSNYLTDLTGFEFNVFIS